MLLQSQAVNAGAASSSRILQEIEAQATIPSSLTAHLIDFRPGREDLDVLDASRARPDALPFEEAFAPFRRYVRSLLRLEGRFSTAAARDLEDEIIIWLSRACCQTLLAEFSDRRSAGLVLAAKLFAHIENAERDVYRNFIRELWSGSWLVLFSRYPVLARLVESIIRLKLDEVAEFSGRLDRDRLALSREFRVEPGVITRIRSGLSDPHHGMRSVKVLEFESGECLVYKPKDLGLQVAWSQLSKWAGERLGIDFATPAVLDFKTHGWMEFIRHDDCADEAGVRRYYRRAGSLVCLLYAIRGSDCHFENLLASGEYPVLIDTETLMQPDFHIAGQSLTTSLPEFLAKHLSASVMQSGMLPSWETAGADQSVNAGGLGGGDDGSACKPAWRYTNTDYMYFGEPKPAERPNTNVPRLRGAPVSAAEYVEEIVAGFTETYTMLRTNREELLCDSGPLAAFRDRTVRFVLRNTRHYQELIRRALHPQYLSSERALTECLSGVIPQLPAWAFAVDARPIWNAEIAALTALDIPIFTAPSDGEDLLTDSGEVIAGAMRRSGYAAVIDQIGGLSEHDLRRQVNLIRLSFRALSAHDARVVGECAVGWAPAEWSAAVFETEARRLGNSLLDTSISGSEGEIGWVALNHLPGIDRYAIVPLNHGLMGGACGIGLFFAALYRISGEARYKEACLAALAKTRVAFCSAHDADVRQVLARQQGLGAEQGLGSIVYAFAGAGEWLDEPQLVDDACRVAALIEADTIAADEAFDVMSGAAGCLLGLLALDEIAPGSCAGQRAALCAAHLISQQQPQEEGGSAWKSRMLKAATGFAHGAAGIAYALARWQDRYPSDRTANAIASALEYERSLYSKDDGNWLDVRSLEDSGHPRYGSSWCHGAPGIGLSRIGMMNAHSDAALLDDIETAVRFVERSNPPQVAHLCCGKLGWIEFLVSAGQRLGRPALVELARRRAAGMIGQTARDGGYRLVPGAPDDTANPSLFVGIAGIGYEMLRLAHPDRLPSILLFE